MERGYTEPHDNDTCHDSMFSFTKIWNYFKLWLLRPLARGLLFGAGHYISLRIIGPFFCERFDIPWYDYKTTS
jgi:hypothetical protein